MTVEARPQQERRQGRTELYYMRHSAFQRTLHAILMPTFIMLAATGLPLKFSASGWARAVASWVGGFEAILAIHKFFASILILLMLVHLFYVAYLIFAKRQKGVLYGETSMTPNWQDVKDVVQHFKFFLGLTNEHPRFGRFTYWEKFDYLAVFWGMVIIGGSGIMLWFSQWFAKFLPGEVFNVALIVHGEEAILAVWFIFTIHIFNSHLRPQKFPMDMVIFTGRETLEELKEFRPAEYERLERTGQLNRYIASPPPHWLFLLGRVAGFTIVAIGVTLFILSLLAMVGA